MEWPVAIRLAYQQGFISNSDLELAAIVLQWMVLEYLVDTTHITTGVFSDNEATVFWTQKMSAKRSKPAASLLRVLSLRLKRAKAAPMILLHIAGGTMKWLTLPHGLFEPTCHTLLHHLTHLPFCIISIRYFLFHRKNLGDNSIFTRV